MPGKPKSFPPADGVGRRGSVASLASQSELSGDRRAVKKEGAGGPLRSERWKRLHQSMSGFRHYAMVMAGFKRDG